LIFYEHVYSPKEDSKTDRETDCKYIHSKATQHDSFKNKQLVHRRTKWNKNISSSFVM